MAMAMDANFTTLLFIFCTLLFHSFSQATNETRHDDCPEEFPCGSLGGLRFPLTQSSRPECGLLTVDCDASVLEFGGDRYDVKVLDAPFLRLSDPKMSTSLNHPSCQVFYRNFSIPNSPSITYRINPVLDLYKCSSKNRTDDQFHGYNNYDKCGAFSLYYKNPYNSSRDEGNNNFTGNDIPPNCSLIQLPRQDVEPNNASGLLPMLASEFFVSWDLSENCSECHYKFRGQCSTDSKTNGFACLHSSSSTSSNKWKWIVLASVLGGFGILIGINYIIWFLKNRTNCLSHNISRNTSSNLDCETYNNYFGAPVFSYSELQEATNNFDTSKELGDGAFGTVYHGKLRDGREVAVKRLYEFNRKRMELFINEVEILGRLRHPNLVTLYGCASRHSHGLLVYEFVSNGTVADHLHGKRANEGLLTWQIRMNISVEIAGALAYLHAFDVIHRDVKTTNILLDNNFRVKVADFGLSRLFPDNVTHVSTAPQGTPGYVDPEYHECYQLTDKSDVYSFGVVLIELISSMPAVDISRHRHEISLANFAMTKILRREFHELIDPSIGVETNSEILQMASSVAELAFQCLQPEKDMRPSMDEVSATLIDIQKGEFKDWKEDDHNLLNASSSEAVQSPASPDSLTDHWINTSSASSNSGGYPK